MLFRSDPTAQLVQSEEVPAEQVEQEASHATQVWLEESPKYPLSHAETQVCDEVKKVVEQERQSEAVPAEQVAQVPSQAEHEPELR